MRKLLILSLLFTLSFSWWNSNWLYRDKLIVLTSNNTQNYELRLNITYDSDMDSNFEDLRFTFYNQSNDSETEIPYWIESFSPNNWVVVWVKIPQLTNNTTIYMYFDNITAVNNESNGSQVFRFFDDFEVWDNWTNWQSGTVSQVTSPSPIYQGRYALKKDNNCHPNGGRKPLNFTLDRNNWIVEFVVQRINNDGTSCPADRIGVGDASGNGYNFNIVHFNNPVLEIDKNTGTSTTVYGAVSLAHDPVSIFYIADLILTPNQIKLMAKYLDTSLINKTFFNDASYSSFSYIYIEGGQPYYVDTIRIRKYIDPEPIYQIVSKEYRNSAPGVEYVSPLNNTLITHSYVELIFNVNDSNNDTLNITLFGDGQILNQYENISSNTQIMYNWTGLINGIHNWSVFAFDGELNSSNDTMYFTINISNLNVSFITPQQNTFVSNPVEIKIELETIGDTSVNIYEGSNTIYTTYINSTQNISFSYSFSPGSHTIYVVANTTNETGTDFTSFVVLSQQTSGSSCHINYERVAEEVWTYYQRELTQSINCTNTREVYNYTYVINNTNVINNTINKTCDLDYDKIKPNVVVEKCKGYDVNNEEINNVKDQLDDLKHEIKQTRNIMFILILFLLILIILLLFKIMKRI